MTSLPPPPPPPSPPAQTPWYRTTSGAIGIGVVAVLIGVVIYLMMSGGDDAVAGSSTTTGASTTAVTTLPPASTTSSTVPATTTSTSTSTSTSTIAATTTSTVTTAPLTLDYSRPANFGEFVLDTGFEPDPAQYDATSGGAVNAAYLGGGCYGFASVSPDLKITYSAGTYPLRFYFIPDTPGADTVLLINGPDGSWYCNDDSWGTLDPTVDFADPLGGRYDIWLASIGPADAHQGTLYVTEVLTNHP